MHGAAAATEVVCDASRKLVANAMHCQTTRLQAPRGVRVDRSVVLLLSVLETDEKNESGEFGNTRNNRFLGFLSLVCGAGFPSPAPSN